MSKWKGGGRLHYLYICWFMQRGTIIRDWRKGVRFGSQPLGKGREGKGREGKGREAEGRRGEGKRSAPQARNGGTMGKREEGRRGTNIAEHVIYLVKGTDIRHLSVTNVEETLKTTANLVN